MSTSPGVAEAVERSIVRGLSRLQLTGHKTRSVFKRYNVVSDGDLREAARRLGDGAGTRSGTVRRCRALPVVPARRMRLSVTA